MIDTYNSPQGDGNIDKKRRSHKEVERIDTYNSPQGDGNKYKKVEIPTKHLLDRYLQFPARGRKPLFQASK